MEKYYHLTLSQAQIEYVIALLEPEPEYAENLDLEEELQAKLALVLEND